MNWKGILWVARKTLSDNKPAILFGTGVMCLGTCAVLTAKDTPKFMRKKNKIVKDLRDERPEFESEEEAERYSKQLKVELVKRVALEAAPSYIPAVIAGAASITAFALSNRDLSKQAAGAVAACSVAEKALNAYQENVVKELGDEVHERILQAMVNEVPEEVLDEMEGDADDVATVNRFSHEINDKLYYDRVTGRIFWSTDEKIRDAESTVNKLLIDVGVATINDFYNALLLDCDSVLGDAVGWRIEDPHARNMDVIFGSRLDRENNTPLITIGYRTCAVNLRELERR